MPAIGNPILESDQLCLRCNSKRKVAKTWTEKIKNNYGVMTLVHKKIICTNKACQEEFDKALFVETEKRAKLYQAKVDSIAKRQALKAQQATA